MTDLLTDQQIQRGTLEMMKKISLILIIFLASGGILFSEEEALTAAVSVSVADLFIAYIAIDSTADAYFYEMYEGDWVMRNMTFIHNLTVSSKDSLEKWLDSSTLSEEDYIAISELVDIYATLVKAAEEFLEHLETAEETDFESYRDEAWAAIAELYGLE